MNIVDMVKKSSKSAAQTGPQPMVLSLSELVAEIDSAAEGSFARDPYLMEEVEQKSRAPYEQYIQFVLENTRFALPLSNALEIGRRPEITPLPNLPKWVLGISNVRGEIVSFLSLKAFFGIPASTTGGERRFLIVKNDAIKVGMLVDRILGILSLDHIERDLRKSPYHKGEIAKFISGVAVSEENLTNILAVDAILSSSRMVGFRES